MRGLLLLACLAHVIAKVSQGQRVVENAQFVLLDSFCYDTRGGVFTVDFVVPDKRFPNQEILMFHDINAPGGFPHVYTSHNSCKNKSAGVAANARIRANDQSLALGGKGTTRQIESIVPRWWYIVLANCDPVGDVEGVGLLDYKMTFTNSNGGAYTGQFGKDVQGIYETSVFVLIVLIFFIGGTTYLICRRRKDVSDQTHQVYFMLVCIAGVHFFQIIFYLADRDVYAVDGIGHPLLEDASILLDVVVQLMMVALFVVVAKGKWISSDSIRGARSVVQVMVLYLACSIALLNWIYTRYNPGLNFTIYSSGAGALLVALRVLSLLWLLTSAQTSWKHEREVRKRAFYVWFSLFATFWFLSYPVVVLLSALMNTWNRHRTVWIVQQIILLITYAIWLACFCTSGVVLKKNEDTAAHGALPQDDQDEVSSAGTV